MGGSPPPPPPPARQPRESAKEVSMYHRNQAFEYAIQAAGDSYTSAVIVKTLADILLPETESQLRNEISSHYTISTDYRKAQIIYATTVQTFLDVDSLVKASIDQLNTIRGVGETYLDNFDRSVIKKITENITKVYKGQSDIQKAYDDAYNELEAVKTLFRDTSKTAAEKNPLYQQRIAVIEAKCSFAEGKKTEMEGLLNEMQTAVDNEDSLKAASNSRGTMITGSNNAIENLRDINRQIQKTYATNIQTYQKELDRRNRWYEYYRDKANLVRGDRRRIVIDPAVFRRLLNWAQNAHMNAVYAAIYAVSSDYYANNDRNKVHPAPQN
jgi:predicted  nucleic acid-binding Zn-ribbon protein